MKNVSVILSLVVITATMISFTGTNGSNDELALQEITIGKQVWKVKNLDVDKFRNGDNIAQAKTNEEWKKLGKNREPAWCYYDNDPANGEKYGKLYNWYAVNDQRGLAPQGWHVPSDEEWSVLTNYLGGEDVSGEKMKSTSGWIESGNGDNESGFSGLAAGLLDDTGIFYGINKNSGWWSATEINTSIAWGRLLGYEDGTVGRFEYLKDVGFSVRCTKD